MSQIRVFFVSFIALLLTVSTVVAQSNPYGGTYGSTDRQRRVIRQCTESYPQKSFARDYPSLANANIYHLDREIREFTKFKCLSSEQIRRLAILYPTDRDKYEYLAYALNYVYDIESYSLAGTVLANHNARDGFYRLLVREGVPAGDYYNVYNNVVGGYACATCPQQVQITTPQYQNPQVQPYQPQNQDNTYNNYPDPRRNTPQVQPNQPQKPQNQSNTYNNYPDPRYSNPQNLPAVYDEPTGNASIGLNSGYRGLMTYTEFATLKERIKQNSLDNGKLEAAKNLTRSNTLTANQVAEIVHLMTLDNNRLEYAKFAYEFTYDRQNYSMVADAMAFTNTRRSLEQFISSKK